MSPFGPERFRAFVLGLPGVGIVEQWNSHVAKVGGKVFALIGAERHDVVFRVEETSFEILTAEPGIGQAAYFAKRRWVSVEPGALDAPGLEAYLSGAHRLVAAGLTRKAKAELGLDA